MFVRKDLDTLSQTNLQSCEINLKFLENLSLFIIPLHCGKKIGELQISQSTQRKYDILSGANYIRKFSWPEQKFLAGEINSDRQWIHKLLIFAAYFIFEYCCSNHLNFCSWLKTEIQIYVGYYKIFVGPLSSFRKLRTETHQSTHWKLIYFRALIRYVKLKNDKSHTGAKTDVLKVWNVVTIRWETTQPLWSF